MKEQIRIRELLIISKCHVGKLENCDNDHYFINFYLNIFKNSLLFVKVRIQDIEILEVLIRTYHKSLFTIMIIGMIRELQIISQCHVGKLENRDNDHYFINFYLNILKNSLLFVKVRIQDIEILEALIQSYHRNLFTIMIIDISFFEKG